MKPRWISILVLAAAGVSSGAQSLLPDHFVLTPAQIARALSVAGTPTAEHQVLLPARVVSTVPDPQLDVVSVESLAKQPSGPSSRVRLACHQPAQCLPFYAMVSGLPPAPLRANPAKGDFAVRAGDHATLIMEDDRAYIRVKVISLENGVEGKWIHVSSLDHKQTYLAEVINSSLLKGSF